MTANPLSITFAKPADGTTLAKVLHVDWSAEWPLVQRVEKSPNIVLHRFRSRIVAGLDDMLSALRGAAVGDEIAVRGEPIRPTGRRAYLPDAEKGAPGLTVVPRQWCAFDWDAVPLDGGIDPLLEPKRLFPLVRKALPPPFRETDCVLQISASAGVKPHGRIRSWHLLDRELTGGQLKLWCRPAIKKQILDPCTLGEAQPHYLAVTVRGGHDPCPERFTIWRGEAGTEWVDCSDFARVEKAEADLLAAEKAERDRKAEMYRQRREAAGLSAQGEAQRVFEATIRKAERAIVGAASGSRHPTYVTEMSRIEAITKRHGHDPRPARERLRTAYLSILSPQEARERQHGSTDGVVRWLETRP